MAEPTQTSPCTSGSSAPDPIKKVPWYKKVINSIGNAIGEAKFGGR